MKLADSPGIAHIQAMTSHLGLNFQMTLVKGLRRDCFRDPGFPSGVTSALEKDSGGEGHSTVTVLNATERVAFLSG